MYSTWPELDVSVVEEFLKGDIKTFGTVYHSFAPKLLAYATTICGSREQAEDIVQDVFVVCWEKRGRIKADYLTNWLVKVTRNMAIKAFRRNVLIAEYTSSANNEASEESMDGLTNEGLAEQRAIKIVNALPPRRKTIFILSRVHQKSYRQIADELNISVRTVENQLSAALKHIRYQVNIKDMILFALISLEHLQMLISIDSPYA